jgi:hypothetical protein
MLYARIVGKAFSYRSKTFLKSIDSRKNQNKKTLALGMNFSLTYIIYICYTFVAQDNKVAKG